MNEYILVWLFGSQIYLVLFPVQTALILSSAMLIGARASKLGERFVFAAIIMTSALVMLLSRMIAGTLGPNDSGFTLGEGW